MTFFHHSVRQETVPEYSDESTFFDAHCCNNPGDGRGFVWSTSKSDLELRPKEKKAFRRLHAAWKIKIAD